MHLLERDAREVVARWERGDLAEAVRALSATLALIDGDRLHEADVITEARRHFGGDSEIEIDEAPLLSPADEGVWIQAWIWMPRDHREDDGDSSEVNATLQG